MTYLASLADVAKELGKDEDPTDLQMVHALDRASALVRDYTGQQFDFVENDTFAMSGTGTHSIQLPQLPVAYPVEVTTPPVVVALLDNFGVAGTWPSVYSLRLDDKSGLLYRIDDVWPIGNLNLEVTYSHGYRLPGQPYSETFIISPLPSLVRRKTASIAACLYALDPQGTVTTEGIGNYNVGYTGNEAGEVAQSLADLYRYRVVDMA